MNEELGNEILFARKNESVIIPSKREEDGAFDIYANFEEDYIIIQPHQTKMIPTGLCSAFSPDYVAILKERGSTGTKGMGQRAGVVDSGYRGEWFVPITNHNTLPIVISKNGILPEYVDVELVNDSFKDYTLLPTLRHRKNSYIIYPYEKAIAQVIMIPVPKLQTKEVTMDELLSYKSKRGIGALGSSSK